MKYYYQKDNEWVLPNQKNHKLGCCDCGLIHAIDFRIVTVSGKLEVQFRARRNSKLTKARRKQMISQGKGMFK